jgi:hypothetical protein
MIQADIAYAEAKAYAFDNPHLDSIQLRERFQILTPERCRKLTCMARARARKEGIEFTYKKPSKNREPIYEAAKAYGTANPTTTPFQLRQLFAINADQSRKIMAIARKANGVPSTPAGERVLERMPNPKQAAILADSAKRKADALEYARQNPNEYVTHIAKRFNVATRELTAARDAERQRRKREEASKPRRKLRRLHAVFSDGRTCDPRLVKDWDYFVRFEKVVV